jgi:hypothetical protein
MYEWNIASSLAGIKNPDQVRNNNPLPRLQQGQEYGAKNCPFHSPTGDNLRSHLPIALLGAVGSIRGCHPLSNYQVTKTRSKQKFLGFPLGFCMHPCKSHQIAQFDFWVPGKSPL